MLENRHIVYVFVLFTFLAFVILYFLDVNTTILKVFAALGIGFLATISGVVGYYSSTQ